MNPTRPYLASTKLTLVLTTLFIPFSMVRGANTIRVPAAQPTIQAAINAASNGDTVLVAPGTYHENINFNGKAITVTSSGGARTTIIDGGQQSSVVTFSTSEGTTSVLNGFTIQNGFATAILDEGGGIYINNASPTITNNIVTNNQACSAAGIAIDYGASPLIQGNTITQNNQGGCSGGTWGGGIGIHAGGSPQIIGNIITNNSIEDSGGGIGMFIGGTPTIENNFISGNSATGTGGGIGLVNDTVARIIQNVIVGNTAPNGGGGIACSVPDNPSDNCYLINNTIANNISSSPGSEVLLSGFDQQLQVVNNIIFDSSAQIALFCDTTYSSALPALSFNDVFNSANGTALGGSCTSFSGTSGNISADPLFVDPANNFHLRTGSPAVDAGSNSPPYLPSTDYDGSPRIVNSIVDMGAYEYFPATMTVSTTSLTFGPTPFGTSSSSQPLTITNSGANSLYLSLGISGDFTETDDCGKVLAAAGNCTVNIVFTPTNIGTRSGSLIIASNAATGAATVALTGTATGPNVMLSTTSLTFATELQGTTSAPQVVNVGNSGGLPLIISTITVSAGFTQTNSCSTPVAAGASCSISVSFAPTSSGVFSGTLTLVDNAPGTPHTVGLNGTGYVYPIPVISPPLQPASATPASGTFTLTINGMGFVDSSIVKWNQSSLATSFVSSTQLTAQVPASDVAPAGTGLVTVVNPTPVGGPSNRVPFEITNGTDTLNFARTDFTVGQNPDVVLQEDLNGDGIPDLIVSNFASNTISVLLGNGDGSFKLNVDYPTGIGPGDMVVADFNHDGKPDLAVLVTGCPSNGGDCGQGSVSVFLGNGDGTFQAPLSFSPNFFISGLIAGDFNGDGKMDLAFSAVGVQGEFAAIYLGNGDGTFQAGAQYTIGQVSSAGTPPIVAGDFNRDGKLDLALAQCFGTTISNVAVLLGNGDGTFQSAVSYPTAPGVGAILAADFNGDGIPDLATLSILPGNNTASILLGNGDGSFQPHVDYTTGGGPASFAAADVNGDGNLDLAVANYTDGTVSILLGNGDGTLQAKQDLPANAAPEGIAAADFNSDGHMDLAVADYSGTSVTVMLQTTEAPTPLVSLSTINLTFTSQPVGSTSGVQTVTLTNTGSAALAIASITASGDFGQTSNCGTSVAAGASCTISMTFTPAAAGSRSGTLTITDNNNGLTGSVQTVILTGTATAPAVNLPPPLTFAAQMVGSTSGPQTITLTNSGNASLTISAAPAVSGPFAIASSGTTCSTANPVAASETCTVAVTFTPTAGGAAPGSVSFSDNAPGSPQSVALSGTGQDFSLAPPSGSSTSASIAPGQNATYTLSAGGEGGLSGIVSFTCTGAPSEATCAVAPNPLTLGNSATNVTVTVTTTAASMGSLRSRPLSPAPPQLPLGRTGLWMLVLAMMALALLIGRRQPRETRGRYRFAVFALRFLLTVAMAACGGGGGGSPVGPSQNPGTPSGTYSLTVTGTTGSGTSAVSHSMSLTLTVS